MIKISNYDFTGNNSGWAVQGEPERQYKALWCSMPNDRSFLLSPNKKVKENEKWEEKLEDLAMIPTYRYPVMVTDAEAKVIYNTNNYVDRVISITIPKTQKFTNIKIPAGVLVLGYRIESDENCSQVVMIVKHQCNDRNKSNIIKFYVADSEKDVKDYCVLIGSNFDKIQPLDNKIEPTDNKIKVRVFRKESRSNRTQQAPVQGEVKAAK